MPWKYLTGSLPLFARIVISSETSMGQKDERRGGGGGKGYVADWRAGDATVCCGNREGTGILEKNILPMLKLVSFFVC